MYLNSEKKEEIFGQYGKSTTDTGSAESQIALFTYRIKHLTEHVKANHKDYVTTRSLTQLVGKRRRLLTYLKERDINRYRAIVKAPKAATKAVPVTKAAPAAPKAGLDAKLESIIASAKKKIAAAK